MNYLLVDTPYLCHRAFHTVKAQLVNEQSSNLIAFQVLRDLEILKDKFAHERIVLAFDSKTSLRQQVYPNYKSTRKARRNSANPEEKRAYALFDFIVDRLQRKILPSAGYRNVLNIEGYEADDIIAKVAEGIGRPDEAVIAANDGDLLQCLTDRVVVYNIQRKEVTTSKSFRDMYQIDPVQWANVKALAGCATDDVEGIEGIGESTASAWEAGLLKPEGKRFKQINANLHIATRNFPLVKIPYQPPPVDGKKQKGIQIPELFPDECSEESRQHVLRKLGFSKADR